MSISAAVRSVRCSGMWTMRRQPALCGEGRACESRHAPSQRPRRRDLAAGSVHPVSSGRIRRLPVLICHCRFEGACGAVGSAPPWHGGGRGFESLQVHHPIRVASVATIARFRIEFPLVGQRPFQTTEKARLSPIQPSVSASHSAPLPVRRPSRFFLAMCLPRGEYPPEFRAPKVHLKQSALVGSSSQIPENLAISSDKGT